MPENNAVLPLSVLPSLPSKMRKPSKTLSLALLLLRVLSSLSLKRKKPLRSLSEAQLPLILISQTIGVAIPLSEQFATLLDQQVADESHVAAADPQ
jgi:hypothetical protein